MSPTHHDELLEPKDNLLEPTDNLPKQWTDLPAWSTHLTYHLTYPPDIPTNLIYLPIATTYLLHLPTWHKFMLFDTYCLNQVDVETVKLTSGRLWAHIEVCRCLMGFKFRTNDSMEPFSILESQLNGCTNFNRFNKIFVPKMLFNCRFYENDVYLYTLSPSLWTFISCCCQLLVLKRTQYT